MSDSDNNGGGLGEIIITIAAGYIIYKIGKIIYKRFKETDEEIVIGHEDETDEVCRCCGVKSDNLSSDGYCICCYD